MPGYQVRIVWLEPATSASGKVQREDARAGDYQRYLGQWTIDKQNTDVAVLKSQFAFPADGGEYLSQSVPEADWQKEPWAFDKAYLVLQFKDESRDLNDHWVSDALFSPKMKAGKPRCGSTAFPNRSLPSRRRGTRYRRGDALLLRGTLGGNESRCSPTRSKSPSRHCGPDLRRSLSGPARPDAAGRVRSQSFTENKENDYTLPSNERLPDVTTFQVRTTQQFWPHSHWRPSWRFFHCAGQASMGMPRQPA